MRHRAGAALADIRVVLCVVSRDLCVSTYHERCNAVLSVLGERLALDSPLCRKPLLDAYDSPT
jgi:hypothetical protein